MKKTGTEITIKILGNEEIDGDSYTDILRIATHTAEIYGSEFDTVFEVGVEFTINGVKKAEDMCVFNPDTEKWSVMKKSGLTALRNLKSPLKKE